MALADVAMVITVSRQRLMGWSVIIKKKSHVSHYYIADVCDD